jgi:4'-phosphopantetheinyl transferase
MPEQTSIELWLVDLDSCAAALEAWERDARSLSEDDRRKADAIPEARERRRRLAAYTALRLLIERHAGAAVRGRAYRRSRAGKPSLDRGGVEFSLSHTEELAFIGLTRSVPIGVDLERVRPVKMSQARLHEIRAAGAGLAREPLPPHGPDRAFLQAWARLEAFTKARGQALSQTLAALGLRGGSRRAVPAPRIEVRARCLADAAGLVVCDARLPPGLHGAVAVGRGVRLPRVRVLPAGRSGLARVLARPALPLPVDRSGRPGQK